MTPVVAVVPLPIIPEARHLLLPREGGLVPVRVQVPPRRVVRQPDHLPLPQPCALRTVDPVRPSDDPQGVEVVFVLVGRH
eukprot:CAMPEP_0114120172 /NCGR_PEP_ID=MMETSP0043_2-20121206/6504_1 /TAXON_ID=464988 /ORGANISM="Hemiselmis andersenii, Strain CCMP644" /LENGTH=79 /DNA_ID=CAMNT_0001212771 /DNA_START=225 /DNA_END=464 /DNA_ORIENTATION=-